MSVDTRLQLLEEENSHLKNMLNLLGVGSDESMFTIPLEQSKELPLSIAGIENMYLQINPRNRVININNKMAELLGTSKREIIDQQISTFDKLPWAENVFITLITECRNSLSDIEWETNYLDVISGTTRYILFKASIESEVITVTVTDKTQYRLILNTFSRYVSPKVIQKMQESTTDFFKTDRLDITVIFADLRGFTAMSSQMDPLDVKDILNEFFSNLIDVVDRYEGTVDKIIGDEIMVLFGAPIPMGNHAYRAIQTAIEMQIAHNKLLKKWGVDNKPQPPLGIGINSGKVVVGNIGSETRMDYTAIGHNVNLASRLCSAANGGEILITENTVMELTQSRCGVIQLQKAGKMLFKGLKQETTVAKVLYNLEMSDG